MGGEKWFCGVCGSHIYGNNPSHPDSIGIRLGAFDDDPGVRPSVRQFVTYAAPWEPIRTTVSPAIRRAATPSDARRAPRSVA